MLRSLPRKLDRPREAMIKAPSSAPIPRAEFNNPFVVALPPKIFTDQAGIRVIYEIPKRLVTATIPIKVRMTG
jgi:hypothetical protein